MADTEAVLAPPRAWCGPPNTSCGLCEWCSGHTSPSARNHLSYLFHVYKGHAEYQVAVQKLPTTTAKPSALHFQDVHIIPGPSETYLTTYPIIPHPLAVLVSMVKPGAFV